MAKTSLASAKKLFETVLPIPGRTENTDWLIASIQFREASKMIKEE